MRDQECGVVPDTEEVSGDKFVGGGTFGDT